MRQEEKFFRGEVECDARTNGFVAPRVHFEVRDTQSYSPCGSGVRRSNERTRAISSEKANGLTK